MEIRSSVIETPLGDMLAAATGGSLCLLEFCDRPVPEAQLRGLGSLLKSPVVPEDKRVLDKVRRQLADYFAGRLRIFSLPVSYPGTAFQRAVWDALLAIPCGQTRSYAEVASAIGNPGAARAVGTANGANRIAIVIPCHRVINADGGLGGYGGGLERKRRLLELEWGISGAHI